MRAETAGTAWRVGRVGRASFSGGEVQENWQFGARQRLFLRQKAPLLGVRVGEIRPKKAPLRIRSSQKKTLFIYAFSGEKNNTFCIVQSVAAYTPFAGG